MKIIITGALGHIGSYLIRDLVLQFPMANIVMIDNLMTQRFPSLFNLPDSGEYKFIEADVTKIDLDPIFKNTDIVIHLAAITDAAGSFARADVVEENNFKATANVAEACVKSGAKLIMLSSTSVYGSQNLIVNEKCSLGELKPQSPYAVTKLKEEDFILKLTNNENLKAVICRFGTIFGISPGMRFHTAVNKFCWQAVMKQPITVWSTAYDQKRPYLDIIDAASAISFIIKHDLFGGEIYNILTCNSTVRNVVESIKEFAPDLQITFVDNQIMNQLSYEVSSVKFTSENFIFSGNLKRGISETISILKNTNH